MKRLAIILGLLSQISTEGYGKHLEGLWSSPEGGVSWEEMPPEVYEHPECGEYS